MRTRAILVSVLVAGGLLAGALISPAQAAPRKLEGFVTAPQPGIAWTGQASGETGTGGETVTAYAFAEACAKDRDAHAAGKPADATHIAEFLAGPLNGFDGYVWDLGKPVEGVFAIEAPKATELVPDVTGLGLFVNDIDLDLDFFTGADVNAADYDPLDGGIGCPNANRVAYGHKCYSHTQASNEKSNCQVGYKVGKVRHLPQYVMVSGSFNLKGPFEFTVTAP